MQEMAPRFSKFSVGVGGGGGGGAKTRNELFHCCIKVQSDFNGPNSFGTMKISSRQG